MHGSRVLQIRYRREGNDSWLTCDEFSCTMTALEDVKFNVLAVVYPNTASNTSTNDNVESSRDEINISTYCYVCVSSSFFSVLLNSCFPVTGAAVISCVPVTSVKQLSVSSGTYRVL